MQAGNLRPPTPDSPSVDFAGWAKAIDTVRGENAAAAQRAPEASLKNVEAVKQVNPGTPVESIMTLHIDNNNGAVALGLSALASEKEKQ